MGTSHQKLQNEKGVKKGSKHDAEVMQKAENPCKYRGFKGTEQITA